MKDTAHWVWQEPYLAALQEQNPFSLRERLLTAEKAMLSRMEVLHDAPEDLPEVQALRKALNALYARAPNKNPGPAKILEDQGEYEFGQRNWTKLGAVVAVAVVVSFATGWILARRSSGNEVQSTGTATEPKANTSNSDNTFASVRDVQILDNPSRGSPSPQDDGTGTPLPSGLSRPSVAETYAQPETGERFVGAVNAKNHGTPSVDGRMPETADRSLQRTTENQPSRPAGEPPARPFEGPPAEPKRGGSTSSWSLNQPQGAPEVRVEPQVGPPPSIDDPSKATEVQRTPPVTQQPISPGSVTVSLSTYPSLRVPPELRSQAVGAKLQLGQVVSRVDPIYPENAERQRIEGTVKLHAIVGTDGSVQGIEGITGPPLLVPAVLGAVRQWRYQPTLLDAQPIETGQDITIVFRLTNGAASAN